MTRRLVTCCLRNNSQSFRRSFADPSQLIAKLTCIGSRLTRPVELPAHRTLPEPVDCRECLSITQMQNPVVSPPPIVFHREPSTPIRLPSISNQNRRPTAGAPLYRRGAPFFVSYRSADGSIWESVWAGLNGLVRSPVHEDAAVNGHWRRLAFRWCRCHRFVRRTARIVGRRRLRFRHDIGRFCPQPICDD